MVLNPLAQVRVRVLMPVVIRSRQFVVHLYRSGKRSQGQQRRAQDEREDSGHAALASPIGKPWIHLGRLLYLSFIQEIKRAASYLHFGAVFATISALLQRPGSQARLRTTL